MKRKEEKKREAYYANPFALPPECDPLCLVRQCFHKYENKGSFSQGRGYLRYYENFRPVCGVRMSQGCPSTRRASSEELNKEKARELLLLPRIPKKIKDALLLVCQQV